MVEDYQENYITGWVKLYRSFINWEWFEVPNMVTVFIYCLIKANHKDKRWRGIEVKKGTFITSLETMSKETHLSTQKIRTCLKHLKNSGEVNTLSNKRYTVVTINKYDRYQSLDETTNTLNNEQLTNSQQTANKQLTTTKKYKNDNNDNNIDIRKNKFFQSINELDYPIEVKTEFFDYWTEKKPKGKKMRFEMEKTFDVNLRLKRWVKNSDRWKKEKTQGVKKEKRSAAQIIQEKHGIKN